MLFELLKMNYLKISIAIFLALTASRLIPHPPNFTSLLAFSFYVPTILGISYLPALIIIFVLTDAILDFYSVSLFIWGSVILIGLMSKFFIKNITLRISGPLLGATLFFLITNFSDFGLGSYGYTVDGLIKCYELAIPFFRYNLILILLLSCFIETVYKFKTSLKRYENRTLL